MRAFKSTALAAAALAFSVGVAAASEAPRPPQKSWSFDGLFGTFERASAKRGFFVYKDV